nr:chloramphenicol resistance protein [uncultured Clostridium sp.]
MIDAIRDYLLTYDYFEKNESFINVNFLDVDIGSFSLDPIPTKPIVKRYIDGGAIKQFEFALTSKKSYSEDYLKNIENCGFYLDFENWIEENNYLGIFPKLKNGMEARELSITTNGILINNETAECIYEITLKLKYYQSRRN